METMAAKASKSTKTPRTATRNWIRNTQNCPIRFRLSAESGKGADFNLKPRGQRGDLRRVTAEQKKNDVYLTNKDVLFEELTDKDAEDIVSKQTNNQQAIHPAFTALRNELGESYTDDQIKFQEQTDDERSVTVANINHGEVAVARDVHITRAAVDGSVDNPVNIEESLVEKTTRQQRAKLVAYNSLVENGLPVPEELAKEVEAIKKASGKTPDEIAQERDTRARDKSAQGPSAGVGNIKVSVEPVQRVS